MKNKESHVSKRSQSAESLRIDVMALLGWSSLEYGNFKFEQGLEYLDYFLLSYVDVKAREHWKKVLYNSPVFWKWWKNAWSNRDHEFVKSFNACCEFCNGAEYRRIHSGKELATAIQPNRIILEESYSHMIKDLIKHEQDNK